MKSESLNDSMLELLARSEKRIDQTNSMIKTLAETCNKNMMMYDKHLESLEKSRDKAQCSNEMAMHANAELIKVVDDYRHALKRTRKELSESREDYRKLNEAFLRMADSMRVSNNTDIKVSR